MSVPADMFKHMSRYRLQPTLVQEAVLRGHCAHARFVWNLGQEQRLMYRPGRGSAPGYLEQCRQLTEARDAEPWLAAGSQMVQQQALRDLDRAWRHFFARTHRMPRWRSARKHNGFRIVGVRTGQVRRLSRKTGEVWVPKAGWVRFRWSRAMPAAKSYRVTLDRAGRWHIAFAVIPAPIAAPGNGEVVGVDRGVVVSAALSTGELLHCPGLREGERARLLRLERKSARQRVRGRPPSKRLSRTYSDVARLRARERDRRRDWAEKTSTDLARRFHVIAIEDLRVPGMTRSARGTPAEPGRNVRAKAGLNRGILASGWGLLARRLEDKAPGRVVKVDPAYTSQRCSECGHVAAENRESQAVFACVVCGWTCNADVNAARNIAAGHAVTARGGGTVVRPVNREPQHAGLKGT